MTEIITTEPVTPPPAPRKTHRVRNTLIFAAAVLGLIVIAGALTGQRTAAPAPHKAAHSAPAVPVAAPAGPDMAGWYLAGGQDELDAVTGDLSQTQADADAYDMPALRADGAQLAVDAQLAQADPPPVDGPDYIAAMGDLASAGRALAVGDITGAGADLNAGAALINQVTAAIPAS